MYEKTINVGIHFKCQVNRKDRKVKDKREFSIELIEEGFTVVLVAYPYL